MSRVRGDEIYTKGTPDEPDYVVNPPAVFIDTNTYAEYAAKNYTQIIESGLDSTDRTVTPADVFTYTVPAGKVAYITGFYWSFGSAQNGDVELYFTRDAINTIITYCKHTTGFGDSHVFIPFQSPLKLIAGDVLKLLKRGKGAFRWLILGWIEDA